MNGSVRHLALPITWLAPELVRLALPDEKRSDCANCPMAGAPFHTEVRCCTYQPTLPNFLVGRALRRGDIGTEKIVARLADARGRTGLGLRPDAAWQRDYKAHRDTDFGRNADWRCPYWVAGPLSCSIWRDRNSVCRTWHCQHDDGVLGHQLWVVVRGLIATVERELAALCERALTAPEPDADAEVWAGYYIAAAEHVEALEAVDLLAMEDEELTALRATVRKVHEALTGSLPDVLAPLVSDVVVHDDQVELVGYSPWNAVRLPKAVFVLLAELDGVRTWQEAVERAQQVDASVRADWVDQLWRHGVLRPHDAADTAWGFEGPDLDVSRLEELLSR